jgi:hypothetical protein
VRAEISPAVSSKSKNDMAHFVILIIPLKRTNVEQTGKKTTVSVGVGARGNIIWPPPPGASKR